MGTGANRERPSETARKLLKEAKWASALGDYRLAIDLLHQAYKMTTSRRLLPSIVTELVGAHVGAEDINGCWYYTKVYWQGLTFDQQQPLGAQILYHVGGAYELMGRWRNAAECYQHALWVSSAENPDFPKQMALIRLATNLARTDRIVDAAEILIGLDGHGRDEAMEAEFILAKALLALVQGELDIAADLAERACKSRGSSARVRCRGCMIIADVMQDKEDFKKAFDWLEEAFVEAAAIESDYLMGEVSGRMETLTSERELRNPT